MIACRGTQLTQFEDVATDLKLLPTEAKFCPGDIHCGFKDYVDKLWPKIVALLVDKHKFGPFGPKKVWCTGEMKMYIIRNHNNEIFLSFSPIFFQAIVWV